MNINTHLRRAKRLATLLDSKFKVGPLSFGLDPLFDVIPGLGSIVGAITSCYVFWIAANLRVPSLLYLKMAINILIDFFFGEIPIVGIFIDLFYKSNMKNIALLEKFIVPQKEDILEGEVL